MLRLLLRKLFPDQVPSRSRTSMAHADDPSHPVVRVGSVAPKMKTDVSSFASQTYRFIAVDVETANSDNGSICQLGLALVSKEGTINTFGSFVDPQTSFDPWNTDLHGIDKHTVRGAPTFEELLQEWRPLLERHILIQHSSFDKRAFEKASEHYRLPQLRSTWLDSVMIARKAWPELKGNGGHGLANLKEYLGLEFDHHDAVEDARAAAEITLLAEAVSGKTFSDLAKSARHYEKPVRMDGSPNVPLYGHVACFTGKLSMSRAEAATYAAGAGITVKTGVSKKISLLVVGDQDLTLLSGHPKSAKHRKADELVEQGTDIRILSETEFRNLIGE